MSHWILEPVVIRTRDGAAVLSLDGTGWDAGGTAPTFPAPDRVELHLRRYPEGGVQYDLIVDVETERCWFSGAEAESSPASGAEALLEAAYGRRVAKTAPDLLLQGFCPYCKAQLYRGWLHKALRRTRITCLVCERTWELPPGAKVR